MNFSTENINDNIKFRTTCLEDESFILNLIKKNMKNYFETNFKGWSDETSKKQFNSIRTNGFTYIVEIKSQDKNCIEYINGNEICFKKIGYFSFYEEPKFKNSYIINDIQLMKEFQNKNIGSQILSFIEKKIKDISGHRIKLLVFKNNPAFSFYVKNNYKKIDEIKHTNTAILIKEFY